MATKNTESKATCRTWRHVMFSRW